ncbi:MAG: hypothetical protein Q8S22_09640 [Eubacteriales bacterium]|jgi:hypothetical protein|nr:hypothetical protein [Eubacteriales bacterium]
MGKRNYTDKDVAYQIAQILVREIGLFDRPQNMTLEAAVEQMIDTGAAPLMTYASLANELNQLFGLMEASNKFTALNIDLFLGMLLKESIDFSYKIDGISHRGRIRKKIGRDIPITAIVVNAKTHLPGKQFFSHFSLPHATGEEMRATATELLCDLMTFYYWPDYLKRVEKVFG